MVWFLDVEDRLAGIKTLSMCDRDLKLDIRVWGKRICNVCNLGIDDDCDLMLGVADVRPLTEVMIHLGVYDLEHPPEYKQWRQVLKTAIKNFLVMLGLKPTQLEIVHRISEELPQFRPRDIWEVDESQLILPPADLMRLGFVFALGNEFDAYEYVAFDNLVKYALRTGSIRAILRLNGVDPYGLEDDYYWTIIYGQGTGVMSDGDPRDR